MKGPEYVRVQFNDIPREFIDEYKVKDPVCFGWVYFTVI